MTFGPQVNFENSREMLKLFASQNYTEIDTAYVYNEGETEKILGTILNEFHDNGFKIATKVNPRITGKLNGHAVKLQFEESLKRLQTNEVDILYLHFPDPNTPITEALEKCADYYEKGMFKELGLSNFPAWMVIEIYYLCKERGWPLPTVYQGMYNALSRKCENELFSALRKYHIRFYAYNPLAGGILSGRYTEHSEKPAQGRFTFRPNYQNRYWKKSFFNIIKQLMHKCKEAQVSVPEASLRWLAWHSFLDPDKQDGILIGASKINHLKQNLNAINNGPLPQSLAEFFSTVWPEIKADAPEYFRFIPSPEKENRFSQQHINNH